MPHVLVVGAGGIGGLLASKLSQNLELSVSIAVRHEIDVLRFTVDGVESRPKIAIVTDPAMLTGVDWVIVATKAYDVASLGPWLGAPQCRGAYVAVAQNGVEQVERLSDFAAADRVLPVIVTYGAERRGPGDIVQTLEGKTRVSSGIKGAAFATMAAPTDLEVELVDDFATALWTKLAWNLVGNSLSTIADLPVREIGRRPELRSLATRLIDECSAVAHEQGARLEADLADTMLSTFSGFPDTVRSSMWQDRQAGRAFEHDAISGAVVRAAERSGLPAPFSLMATMLLKTLSSPTT